MNYSIRDPSAGSASQLIFSSMEMRSCSSVNDQRQLCLDQLADPSPPRATRCRAGIKWRLFQTAL